MKKLLLLLITTLLNATGDPYINIKLKPIATNYSGAVLFQTYSDINTYGSYSCSYDKFAWLVVSADGIWDERVAYETSEIFDNDCNLRDKKKYDAYKTGKISLKNPDKILAKLQAKYYFNCSIAESNEKYKVLEIKPKQSCFSGKCIDKVLPQKSVEGFVSTTLRPRKNAQSLRSSFYYKGVALMRTPMYVNEETIKYDKYKNDNPISYQQNFNLPKLAKGRRYSATFIDSIVFVEPFEFRQPTTDVKREVEELVRDVIELVKESNVKSVEQLNAKYIHSKYGFYLLYRMGACDSIEHHKTLDPKNLKNKRRGYAPIDYLYMLEKSFKFSSIEWQETSFDCGTEAWSKKGVFVHANGYDVVSTLCEFNTNAYSNEEKVRIKFLTKDTLVVSITEYDITFELKKIDGHWYVVVINGVETDCSA